MVLPVAQAETVHLAPGFPLLVVEAEQVGAPTELISAEVGVEEVGVLVGMAALLILQEVRQSLQVLAARVIQWAGILESRSLREVVGRHPNGAVRVEVGFLAHRHPLLVIQFGAALAVVLAVA